MSEQPDAQTSTCNNTQQSQETDINAAYGIQTRNPSKQVVADPHAATGIGMFYFAVVNQILRDSKEIHLCS
jgi:hypothetical protein